MIRTEVLDPGRYNIIREVSCEAVETQLRCFGSVLNSLSFFYGAGTQKWRKWVPGEVKGPTLA